MRDGFIKVAAGIPDVTVADVKTNTENIKSLITKADTQRVNLLVFPELSVTGYTCGDLFFNQTLIAAAKEALFEIAQFTADKYPVVVVGLPVSFNSKLYNCAAVLSNGEILGVIPKTYLPDHAGFNEKRYFESGINLPEGSYIVLGNEYGIDFGTDLIFTHSELDEFSFGVEICEDLFAPEEVNRKLALGGAGIILNPAACNQTVGKDRHCRLLVSSSSARLNCGYVFTSAASSESTTDMVFGGQAIIAENGTIIAENNPFGDNDIIISEIDVKRISSKRQRNTSFIAKDDLRKISFSQEIINTKITRIISKSPFIPDGMDINTLAEQILQIQSHGLKKRLEHTKAKKAVVGISGGLDSTLALLTTVRAMKLLSRPMSDILCITMPCFGTTKRTRSNSELLCRLLGVSFKEVNITASVKQHFADIEQSEASFDVTYENSQARERTQVLMDIANQQNGMVIGTGDLSELALGWATYNGDHMSMYGVNADVPKTLVRHLVNYEASNTENELKKVLLDILDTPVSPELLPANESGDISQKTEDLVGPYELHDFFLYHTVGFGETPKKIFRLAAAAFEDYDKPTILKWLTVFTRRFITQQFKRSCLPDGPMVCSVSLSPRGGLQMPTDVSYNLWLKEIEEIEI